MSDSSDQQRRFLLHFEANHRGHIMNIFLEPIRVQKLTEPRSICSAVYRDVNLRLGSRWLTADRREKLHQMLHWLREDQEGALDLAAACLEWERLPASEREQIKEQRAQEGKRAWMERQPATERQIAFLRKLGYSGPVNSMAEASDLIEKWKPSG